MARYFDVHPRDPQPRAIAQAVAMLHDDALIAYPTDSCYALGFELDSRTGAERIRAAHSGADVRVDLTPPADGDYTLSVEHLHYWGGPAESYHLSIKPYEPGFTIGMFLDRYDECMEDEDDA